MSRNVEIKASVADLNALLKRASELSDLDYPWRKKGKRIAQRDIFFHSTNGRMKLRRLETENSESEGIPPTKTSELIYYDRKDDGGPKTSFYKKMDVSSADEMEAILSAAYGKKGEVVKTRRLFMVGQTRVHCDQVAGLGDFLELEVTLSEGESEEKGVQIANDLMEKLGVAKDDLISGAYMDLILGQKNGEATVKVK